MRKIFLDEKDMPRAWYNIQADMPSPLPPPSLLRLPPLAP